MSSKLGSYRRSYHIFMTLPIAIRGNPRKKFRSKLGFCPNQLDPKFQPKELERLRPGPRAQIHLDATRGLSRKAGKQVACRNPPSSHCHLYWLLRY